MTDLLGLVQKQRRYFMELVLGTDLGTSYFKLLLN